MTKTGYDVMVYVKMS